MSPGGPSGESISSSPGSGALCGRVAKYTVAVPAFSSPLPRQGLHPAFQPNSRSIPRYWMASATCGRAMSAATRWIRKKANSMSSAGKSTNYTNQEVSPFGGTKGKVVDIAPKDRLSGKFTVKMLEFGPNINYPRRYQAGLSGQCQVQHSRGSIELGCRRFTANSKAK